MRWATRPDELPDSAAHFVRGFIGKRYGQDGEWRETFLSYQPGNPVSKHTCFAGAGAGHDEQRPVRMGDGH